MTNEQISEQGLKELRNFPKIANAQVFGNEILVIETTKMHLYTEDRSLRAETGPYTFVIVPDKYCVKNQNPPIHGLHHPHVDGTYVSLADHQQPLSKACKEKDWVTCGFIAIKFLEEYKFGEKAKYFFELGMERKEDGKWVVVPEKERKDILNKDKRFQFSGTGYGSSKFEYNNRKRDEEDDKVRELILEHFPEGTRVRYNGSTVDASYVPQKIKPGRMGRIHYSDGTPRWISMPIEWDEVKGEHHRLTWKPLIVGTHDISAIDPGTGEELANTLDLYQKVQDHMHQWEAKNRDKDDDNDSFMQQSAANYGLAQGYLLKGEDDLEEDYPVDRRSTEQAKEIQENILMRYFPPGTRVKFIESNFSGCTVKKGEQGVVQATYHASLDIRWDRREDGIRFTPMLWQDNITALEDLGTPDNPDYVEVIDFVEVRRKLKNGDAERELKESERPSSEEHKETDNSNSQKSISRVLAQLDNDGADYDGVWEY